MNPSKNYIALMEGRMAKSEFLRQARQAFPNLIGANNSFEDALKILTRRGLINEELIYQNKADKFPLESIERGIRYELEVMDVYDIHHPSQEQYKKARQRAIDNLGKNPLYYIDKIAANTEQPKQEDTEGDLKKVTPSKKNLQESRYITEAPAEDLTQLNKKFLDLYIKYKDGNYQVKDKNTGELKPGKMLAPETAAQKACLVIRKVMNAPRFRPDRNTIASCSTGRGKLQYQGENNGVPTFNYAWSIREDELGEASKNGGDPVWTQFYQHFLKKYKEAKDPNADHNARIKANQAFKKYQEKHSMQESKKGPDTEKLVLKEHIIHIIGKVLSEAATANLAQLSDENASVSELPGIINSLENIVTEIESFWIKEQQKIQGVFDQVGNIKNEDGLPVGYKFVQPIMDSLKKDLEPVLAKISLEDLKLPEAPAPDSTEVNDPNAEELNADPNAVPEVPEKKTVFSPAAKAPLQENKNRRYTK